MSKFEDNEIKFDTFIFENKNLKNNYLYNLFHSYKETNNKTDLCSLILKLEASIYSGEDIDYTQRLIEIAYKENEVIGFCLHSKDSIYPYTIYLLVCTPNYRKQNIGAELLNRTLINISNLGFDTCSLESSERLDSYGFWISKGAKRIKTRYLENMFSVIEIGVLQIDNIKEHLNNLIEQENQKKYVIIK